MKRSLAIIAAIIFLAPLVFAYVTESVPEGCGYTDHIYTQIPVWTQEKSELNLAYSGKQGETGRRLLMYSDQSWILTFEFFSKDDVSYDLSCVVKTGVSEEAYEALSVRIEKLPLKRIGPDLRQEDEARLVIRK